MSRPPDLAHRVAQRLAGLNEGTFEAAMVMLSPVRRLRLRSWGRRLVEKMPNPAMATVSFLASASPMTEKTALTALSATALWRHYMQLTEIEQAFRS